MANIVLLHQLIQFLLRNEYGRMLEIPDEFDMLNDMTEFQEYSRNVLTVKTACNQVLSDWDNRFSKPSIIFLTMLLLMNGIR